MEYAPFEAVIFDLDGTLTESAPGIVNSIRYALKKAGLPPLSEAELLTCVGPPLSEQLMALLHISSQEALALLPLYREYFIRKGMFENRPYDGIAELLGSLHAAGMPMMVCTGKPEPFAKTILEHFELESFFCDCIGSTLDGRLKDKEEALAILLKRNGARRALMIGDRKYDVEAASANGIPCAGVLWGYGSQEELEQAGADYLCRTPEELRKLILHTGGEE